MDVVVITPMGTAMLDAVDGPWVVVSRYTDEGWTPERYLAEEIVMVQK